jgi:hypothetical protein
LEASAHSKIPLSSGSALAETSIDGSKCSARESIGARIALVPGAAHTNAWAVAPDEFPRRVLGWFASHQ